MLISHIQNSLKNVIKYYTENPEKAIAADKSATARIESGLRCIASGPDGAEIISDMPKGIGGSATAPTPGWLLRAALANCDATMIALRAAELGITLTTLEVVVSSISDNRGLLQIDDNISPGPLNVQIDVKLGGKDLSKVQLQELIDWAERHSPVGDAITRAIPHKISVEVV